MQMIFENLFSWLLFLNEIRNSFSEMNVEREAKTTLESKHVYQRV